MTEWKLETKNCSKCAMSTNGLDTILDGERRSVSIAKSWDFLARPCVGSHLKNQKYWIYMNEYVYYEIE